MWLTPGHAWKKKYRHIPWNRYNLEKYRDINFWSYRPALLLIIPCMIVYVTNNKEPWTNPLQSDWKVLRAIIKTYPISIFVFALRGASNISICMFVQRWVMYRRHMLIPWMQCQSESTHCSKYFCSLPSCASLAHKSSRYNKKYNKV